MTTTPIRGDIFEHYKGGRYVVIGIGKSTVDGSEVVVYRLHEDRDDTLWVRPLDEWHQVVNHQVSRFVWKSWENITK